VSPRLSERDGQRVAEAMKRLGVAAGEPAVMLAALTHKSYANEHREEAREDNERLEFLGDAVIDLAVSHRLMERFPQAREGELSRLRAAIVDEEGLVAVAREIGLGELLLLGRGEELSGGREKPSLLADALEAVIGAIYLSGGLGPVLELVDRHFGKALERLSQGLLGRDAKTQLQEITQSAHKASPRYRVVSESGPDHSKTFVIEVVLGESLLGKGEGRSKKEAEQAAARDALNRMGTPS
jgi:ribonuclease-3